MPGWKPGCRARCGWPAVRLFSKVVLAPIGWLGEVQVGLDSGDKAAAGSLCGVNEPTEVLSAMGRGSAIRDTTDSISVLEDKKRSVKPVFPSSPVSSYVSSLLRIESASLQKTLSLATVDVKSTLISLQNTQLQRKGAKIR